MTLRYRPSPVACAFAPPRIDPIVDRPDPNVEPPPGPGGRSRIRVTTLVAAMVAVVAAGCAAVRPEPLRLDAIEARSRADRDAMAGDQEPIGPVLTIEQVAARAIKYNLEHRQRLLETAVQQGVLEVDQFEMLPTLTANAGYRVRSNDLYARQRQLGQPYNANAPYTTSSERGHRLAGVEFGWNLLDFGMSYYRARIQADQVLIADERRRKVVQNILQDVRSVYWRSLGAQRLAPKVDDLIRRSDAALARAREIEKAGLMPVPQALAYQRTLLDSITLLQSRRHEMEASRAELASLMNAGDSPFVLSDLAEEALPPPPTAVADLEDLALASRPELREEDYRKRISANEARRAIASTWPGVSLDLGWQYDSNRYLLHDSWAEGGLRVSLNLLRLAAIPSIQRQAAGQARLDDTRRLVQSMAVVTQVRVAALGYGLARNEFDTYSRSAEVDERLATWTRASASSRVDADLEVIRTEARAMLSEYQRYIAYANAQAAIGRLYHSIGFDVATDDLSVPVRTLATGLRQSVRRWEWITFGEPGATAPQPLPVVALRVDGVDDPATRILIEQAFADVYRRQGLDLVPARDVSPGLAVWTLVTSGPGRRLPPASLGLPAAAVATLPADTLDPIDPTATRSDMPAALLAPATPGHWQLAVVGPDGRVAARAGYDGPTGTDGIAFGPDGAARGAAESSAGIVRDFVIGSLFRGRP